MSKVYREEGIELYLGDCMELLKDIPSNSVDLVLVDPPYGTIKGMYFETGGKNYGVEGGLDWDEVLPLDELFKEYRRIVRLKGRVVIFNQGDFTWELMKMSDGRMKMRHKVMWKKPYFSNPLVVRNSPAKFTEDILVFTKEYPDSWEEDKELKDYATDVVNYIGESGSSIHKEKGDQTLVHFFTKGYQFSLPTKENYRWLVKRYGINKMENYLTYEEMEKKKEKTDYKTTYNIDKGKYNPDVLEYNKDRGNSYHPTEKPVDLLSHLIRVYSNEGDLVLDNTMGSGSTGVAAKQEGRRFIGMELDEGFYNTAIKRIKEAKRKK